MENLETMDTAKLVNNMCEVKYMNSIIRPYTSGRAMKLLANKKIC